MKKIIFLAALLLPLSVSADHLDVIQVELKEDCSLSKFVQIKDDFNKTWGKKHNYNAEVGVALQSNDLTSMFWIGRSSDAASFGKAWDTWRDEIADPDSVAGKLSARFSECSDNKSRRSYDLY